MQGKYSEKDKHKIGESPWALTGAVLKNFPNLSWSDVVYRLSYNNIILLCKSLPTYDTHEAEGEEKEVLYAEDMTPEQMEKAFKD